jgi:ABC-type branched-subunit amino acid transport system substrate-binding protein
MFSVADEYGMGLRDATAAALERRGVAVTDQVTLPHSTSCAADGPVETVVGASLRRARAAVAVFAARTGETACAIRVLAARRPGMRFVAGDGTLGDSGLLALAGAAVDSLYLVAFWHADRDPDRSAAFRERFLRLSRREPHHGDALAYDAALVLAAAVRVAGPDGGAVRRYLASLGGERPPFDGLTGPVAFGAHARRPLVMTRVSRATGRTVVVEGS